MKKLFFTGLVFLLPITITLLVAAFIVDFFAAPFQEIIESILKYYDLLDEPIWVLSDNQVLFLSSKLIVVTLLITLVFIVGVLGHFFLGKSILQIGHTFVERIPIVNKLYKAIHDVTNMLFSSKESAFSQVVLVPFPHEGAYSLGLLGLNQEIGSEVKEISVFIPCSPNPSFGYTLVFAVREIKYIDMPVDQALKSIVSCGAILPGICAK